MTYWLSIVAKSVTFGINIFCILGGKNVAPPFPFGTKSKKFCIENCLGKRPKSAHSTGRHAIEQGISKIRPLY